MKKTKKTKVINDIEIKENNIENSVNEIFTTNLQPAEIYNICVFCENLTPKSKVCVKIDCDKCKGSVIQWINENNSFCPIGKW